MESDNAPALSESSFGSRLSGSAASLRIALEERRLWVAGTQAAAPSSPPRAAELAPGEIRLPLQVVVHRLLEEWGVESTDSEDEDDFCGWRVGSRMEPLLQAEVPLAATSTPTGAFGVSVRAPPSGGFGVTVRAPTSRAASASGGASLAGAPAAVDRSGSATMAVARRDSHTPTSGRPAVIPLPANSSPSSIGTKCLLM